MIHYICVATENKLYLKYLKELIPSLIILGMDMKWNGFNMKYDVIINYLKTLNENDIVCIIDAYDILPTKKLNRLEKRFLKFSKKHKNIKMIIGCDNQENMLFEIAGLLLFDSVDKKRINAGQYIGFVKNILDILNKIFNIENIFFDDQIELTKYAKNNKKHIYIDNKKKFFNVITKPLYQCENDSNACFIHANLNGMLENFLLKEHNILVPKSLEIKNYIENITSYLKKIKLYFGYYKQLFKIPVIK